MTASHSTCSQATERTEHFTACVPFLRRYTLQPVVDVVLASTAAQSVNHRDLAPQLPGVSSLEAKKRRVERAVHDEQLSIQVVLALLSVHLPSGKVLMSLDRTTWEQGKSPLNLRVLGVVVHAYTLPLVWVALDHTGTSDTRARMELVLHPSRVVPVSAASGHSQGGSNPQGHRTGGLSCR